MKLGYDRFKRKHTKIHIDPDVALRDTDEVA
jgi:hypothetical protein